MFCLFFIFSKRNEILNILSEGQLFGDFALDSVKKKRTAQVQAIDDCIFGFISNEVYEKYIFLENNKIRLRDLDFLNSNVIFSPIKSYQFGKSYFCEFTPKEYFKGEVLLKQGQNSEKIIFIKEGKIEVCYQASLVEMEEFLKELIRKGSEFGLHSEEETQDLLLKVTNERIAQIKSLDFIKSIKKQKNYLILLLKEKDMIGLEPLFFSIKQFYTGIVKTDKCKTFEIDRDKLDIILSHHEEVRIEYKNIVTKKLNAFIKRFLTIKTSLENLFESKNNYNNEIEKAEIIKMKKKKFFHKLAPININFQNTISPHSSQNFKINKNNKNFVENDENYKKNKTSYEGLNETLSDEKYNRSIGTDSEINSNEDVNKKFTLKNLKLSKKIKKKTDSDMIIEENSKNTFIGKHEKLYNNENNLKDENDFLNKNKKSKSKKNLKKKKNAVKTFNSKSSDLPAVIIDKYNYINDESSENNEDSSFSNLSDSKFKFNFFNKEELPEQNNKLEKIIQNNNEEEINNQNNKEEEENSDNKQEKNSPLNPVNVKKKKVKEIFLSQFQANVITRSLYKIRLKKGMLSSGLNLNTLKNALKFNSNKNLNEIHQSETVSFFKNNKIEDDKKKIDIKKNLIMTNPINQSNDDIDYTKGTTHTVDNVSNGHKKLPIMVNCQNKKFFSNKSVFKVDMRNCENKILSNNFKSKSINQIMNNKKCLSSIIDNTNETSKYFKHNNFENDDKSYSLAKSTKNYNLNFENTVECTSKKIFNKSEKKDKHFKNHSIQHFNRTLIDDFNKSASNINTPYGFTQTSLFNTTFFNKNKNTKTDYKNESSQVFHFPHITRSNFKNKSIIMNKQSELNSSLSNFNMKNFTENDFYNINSPKMGFKFNNEPKNSEDGVVDNLTKNGFNNIFLGDIKSKENQNANNSNKFPKHNKVLKIQTKPTDLLSMYTSYLNRDIKRNLFQTTITNKTDLKADQKKNNINSIKIDKLDKEISEESKKIQNLQTLIENRKKKNFNLIKKNLEYLKKL